jgi:hypothetical protein
MTMIKRIFQTYGPEYLARFESAMPRDHLKVIHAITNCRTSCYGIAVYGCEECGEPHLTYRSCGNRHCPGCQHQKAKLWLHRQMQRQVPGHHFMLTFTVPAHLRRFIRSHQRIGYATMFEASSATIKVLSKDPRYIGGDLPGFFGVLHTWGRQLQYHPHIHYVVPGGAMSKSDGKWHPSRLNFFLPVKAMSKIFKAKFSDLMRKSGLYDQIPSEVWEKGFNVNCQAVGSSHHSIKYLAPYVFKVAISNHRVIKVENRRVLFKYKKGNGRRWRTMSLEVMEFIRRFLQHVLPTGFMKIRYYGFLNPNCGVKLDKIKTLIRLSFAFTLEEDEPSLPDPEPMVCHSCGGNLKYRGSLLPSGFFISPG